jgi:hypothetical protein
VAPWGGRAEAPLGKKAPLLQPLAKGGAGSPAATMAGMWSRGRARPGGGQGAPAGATACLQGSARLLSIPVGRATAGEGARPRHGGEELGS